MIKLNKPKVVPQDPIKKLLTLLKNEKHFAAVAFLMLKMPPLEAAEYVKDKVVKSEFRTYRLAITRFVDAFEEYKKTQNKKKLQDYLNTIDFKFADEIYHLQCIIDKVFTGLIEDNSKLICEGLYYLVTRFDVTINEDEYDEAAPDDTKPKFKSIAADLAAKVFPEAGALKILFGDKNGP